MNTLTREEIEQMKAGQDLDIAVFDCLGLSVDVWNFRFFGGGTRFSESIDCAFFVVNMLESETPTILTDVRRMSMNGEKSGLQWFAHMRKITGENIYAMMGDVSLPVAICKAALMIKNGYHS